MKYSLPNAHGLNNKILNDKNLVPKEQETHCITDIQYLALEAGVAKGKSILAVAPTSTGETNIALWGLLSWLNNPHISNASTVYLVSHRALARQKFEEFRSTLLENHLDADMSAIVVATGDSVEDGTGTVSTNPLDAPILVATYEKYLGLLSGAGIKDNMSHVLVICDEIQILGDATRGKNVEILLTLLKSAKVGQLVALSAVIDPDDAKKLAQWLGLSLVLSTTREKHLSYECRLPTHVISFETKDAANDPVTTPAVLSQETVDIVLELQKEKANLPIVVFCMTVAKVHECVDQYIKKKGIISNFSLPLLFGFNENTEAARQLTNLVDHRIAFHTADLLDEERRLVEDKLLRNEIDVIFSTTTLGAGVNFPFTTALFDSWHRWDFKRKAYFPIDNSEFQNMAGRAGRMGFSSSKGRIIFCSNDNYNERKSAAKYLNPDQIAPLKPQLTPTTFEQVALWLISCGMCDSSDSIKNFLFDTFSASIEKSQNVSGLDHWNAKPDEVIQKLRAWGFIL